MNWKCKHTWEKSAINTAWCLLGCSIGDFCTIYAFQIIEHSLMVWQVMLLAMINGLATSIMLETYILSKQMNFTEALKTAFGMSFISMIAMELAMNLTDYFLTGGAMIVWYAVPIMLIVGFITPWPYNYWRLKKYNASCH
jgi:phosphatidylglycerophosphate synthase